MIARSSAAESITVALLSCLAAAGGEEAAGCCKAGGMVRITVVAKIAGLGFAASCGAAAVSAGGVGWAIGVGGGVAGVG